MSARDNSDSSKGKQKRASHAAKKPNSASLTSSGKPLSIRNLRAGQTADKPCQHWPRVLAVPMDEAQQSYAVARLAVGLCELQRAELPKLWEAEDQNFKLELHKATHMPEQQAALQMGREKQLRVRVRSLDPRGFLPAAWELFCAAREQVTRPETEWEYVVERDGSDEAIAEAVVNIRSKARVPFRDLCDPNAAKGATKQIHGIRWPVYKGEEALRQFEKLFWDYWRQIGKNWQARPGFVSLQIPSPPKSTLAGTARPRSTVRFQFSRKEVAEMAKKARNSTDWQSEGAALLIFWVQFGIPPADFLALAKFRTARHKVRHKNLKTSKAKTYP